MEGNDQAIASNAKAHVHIFGPLKLQNELMCEFLESSTGLPCMCWEDSVTTISDIETGQKSVILWDCVDTDLVSLWGRLDVSLITRSFFTLFNVSRDLGIHREAANRGVRGIFLENEKPHEFTKGIQAILNGELWFPRDILAKCLLETEDSAKLSKEIKPRLTPREEEVLIMIASGNTNSRIGEELFISLHTVKTHISNIYEKINAPNRLQAALWAIKNL